MDSNRITVSDSARVKITRQLNSWQNRRREMITEVDNAWNSVFIFYGIDGKVYEAIFLKKTKTWVIWSLRLGQKEYRS